MNDSNQEELKQQYELLLQKYHDLQQKYQLLANSKAGRFILAYWKIKDYVIQRIKTLKAHVLASKKRKPIPEKLLPSITVIIPTYKENPYLNDAVCSVLEQDYPTGKIVIMLSVNGSDNEYFERLKDCYIKYEQIRVLYTKKQSVAAARNVALAETGTECVCFLDDDDWLTRGYLRSMATRMYKNVNIVCASLCDCYFDITKCSHDTYINRTLLNVGQGICRRHISIAPLFSSLPAKLYRTAMLKKDFSPMDEQIRSAEDVLYWAKNYGAIHGYIYICDANQNDHYMRRITAGSLSRPISQDWRIYVTDRLEVIVKLEALLERTEYKEERQFISTKIDAQKKMLAQYISTLEKPMCSDIEDMISYYKSTGQIIFD